MERLTEFLEQNNTVIGYDNISREEKAWDCDDITDYIQHT